MIVYRHCITPISRVWLFIPLNDGKLENNQLRGGNSSSASCQVASHDSGVDYFPVIASPVLFYSLNIMKIYALACFNKQPFATRLCFLSSETYSGVDSIPRGFHEVKLHLSWRNGTAFKMAMAISEGKWQNKVWVYYAVQVSKSG